MEKSLLLKPITSYTASTFQWLPFGFRYVTQICFLTYTQYSVQIRSIQKQKDVETTPDSDYEKYKYGMKFTKLH